MVEFTVKNLEIFLAVAAKGSFTQAANELYLSQSTVSAAISSLEKALGAQLLLRNARKKVELTEKGKRLYPLARQVVDQCLRVQSLFR